MAEKSSFFNAQLAGDTWDRSYVAEDYANYFGSFVGNGVFPNPSTGLQVISNNNMSVTVKPGKAWINGYMYYNTTDLTLSIEPADGVLKRIDRIVVRLDLIGRLISCKVVKGTFASSPAPPTLTRNVDVYELCVANIQVNNGVISIIQSNITDTKLDDTVCGIVTQTIKEIDTTTLFNKLQGFIDERGADVQHWMDTAVKQWEIDFKTWFDTIKGILDGDVAGNLANRILVLENKVGSGLVAESVTIKDTNNYFTATNVEGALDELFISADNYKKKVAGAIGSPVTATDTAEQAESKINTMKSTFKTNLTNKGVNVTGINEMSILIDKVATIPLGKKWASGIASQSVSTKNFTGWRNGSTGNKAFKYITFSNIGFNPSTIFGVVDYVYNNITYKSVVFCYFIDTNSYSGTNVVSLGLPTTDNPYLTRFVTNNDTYSDVASFKNGVFEVPVFSISTNDVTWYAFE